VTSDVDDSWRPHQVVTADLADTKGFTALSRANIYQLA